MEKKVYSSYAFKENEKEMMKINRQIYEELEQNDIVYSRKACYAHGEYRIYKCPDEVTLDELALICDGGNLCFGYRGDKKFLSVSED